MCSSDLREPYSIVLYLHGDFGMVLRRGIDDDLVIPAHRSYINVYIQYIQKYANIKRNTRKSLDNREGVIQKEKSTQSSSRASRRYYSPARSDEIPLC